MCNCPVSLKQPDEVLGRKLQQLMAHVIDLGVGGHCGGGSKGPAAAAHALVSDWGDHTLLSPVNLCWQVLKLDVPLGEILGGDAVI